LITLENNFDVSEITYAFIIDLGVSQWTDALVASGSVEAFVFAVVLTGGAFVQIPTRNTVRIKDVAFRTGTDKTSLRVLTGEFARGRSQFAFVDI